MIAKMGLVQGNIAVFTNQHFQHIIFNAKRFVSKPLHFPTVEILCYDVSMLQKFRTLIISDHKISDV